MNEENVKYLSVEQMDAIENKFTEVYTEHDQIMYLHEKESEYVHSDLGFMWSENKDLMIIFTVGMSASENSNMELFITVPKNMILDKLTCEICEDKSEDWYKKIDHRYLFLIKDLIRLTKLPEMTGEIYDDGHTIMMNMDNPYYYGFRKIFDGNICGRNISFCYLVPLTPEKFDELPNKNNWKERLSYLDNNAIVYDFN